MTRSSLESFAAELHAVHTHVSTAYAGQRAFETSQHESSRAIPQRLNATVSAMPAQHRRNAQGINGLEQRNEHIRQQIRSAVSALQAGDITRQNLEHAEAALAVLNEPHELTAGQHRALTLIICALQAAQLSASAQEFGQNVRQIAGALTSMAGEARTLAGLARSTYGADENGKATFIADLEAQVGAALSLFKTYQTARTSAAETMATASAAAEGLCTHLLTVQSLEDDIRIMGLNTTLQCARVGPEGRALGLIAQELRAYGNQFAREASALIKEVENLAETAGAFVAAEPDTASVVATVMQSMQDAVQAMRQIGQTLDDTLTALERDSNHVGMLLEQSAATLASEDRIGEALRRAAASLHAIAPPDAVPPLNDLTPHAQQTLDRLARFYTMASERVIHERIIGRPAKAPPAAPVTAAAELEDMLF